MQEYDASESSVPQASRLQTEYLRGEGMGGGVGGMVYSIRSDGIRCSHANHRGDVVMRTGSAGQLTWFARYEAYGTRFDEWGSNPDRQMSNTKDEEKDLGLVNGGMRPRHLFDGTWLTRDPSGYSDGPNLYCHVHCNPITHFDAWGLDTAYIYDGSDNGRGMSAGGDDFKKSVDALIAKGGGHPINASGLESANSQLKELVVDEQVVIDRIVIIDHGVEITISIGDPKYTNMQELGDDVIKPDGYMDKKRFNELGQYLDPKGVIELYGCRVGKDGKAVQDYADIANRSVKAYTGNTDYWTDSVPATSGKEVKKDPTEAVVKNPNTKNPQTYRGVIRVDKYKEQEESIKKLRNERDKKLAQSASGEKKHD